MPRLDRAITLNLVQPLARSWTRFCSLGNNPPSARFLPILMYHRISDDPEPGISSYYRTVTTPGRFAAQMRSLDQGGWCGVSLRAGLEWLQTPGHPSVKKPVAITFDDGFHDFKTVAAPLLRERGFSATMFLPMAFIASDNQRLQFKGHDCLTWSEVRDLHECGFEFGSHTVNHPELVDLSWPEIERELSDSRQQIERNLGGEVSSFAYPFAFPQGRPAFVARLQEVLRATGYSACVTTEVGRATERSDPLRLKRLPINDEDDFALLNAKLEGAYDWFAQPQRFKKTLSGLLR